MTEPDEGRGGNVQKLLLILFPFILLGLFLLLDWLFGGRG